MLGRAGVTPRGTARWGRQVDLLVLQVGEGGLEAVDAVALGEWRSMVLRLWYCAPGPGSFRGWSLAPSPQPCLLMKERAGGGKLGDHPVPRLQPLLQGRLQILLRCRGLPVETAWGGRSRCLVAAAGVRGPPRALGVSPREAPEEALEP